MFGNILALVAATLVAVVVTATSAQTICSAPVQDALFPCWCEEVSNLYQKVYCQSDAADADLKAVFERTSAVLDDDTVVLTEVLITEQGMVEIPANFFGGLKFERIRFGQNRNLQWVHPDAFNSTAESLRVFVAESNSLGSVQENTDLFKVIGKLVNLEELDIQRNRITYIPDDPFPSPMPHLKKVVINNNRLDYLGARFFANLPALEHADLSTLELYPDKLSPGTFEGIAPNVSLLLNWNEIDVLSQEIFSPVLNSAGAALFVGGRECGFGWCAYRQFHCDERINWICQDVDYYEPKLDGYYCKDGAGADHIWLYCDKLNNGTLV